MFPCCKYGYLHIGIIQFIFHIVGVVWIFWPALILAVKFSQPVSQLLIGPELMEAINYL